MLQYPNLHKGSLMHVITMVNGTLSSHTTGTLTKNEMMLKEVLLSSKEHVFVSGNGYEPKGEFRFKEENETTRDHLKELLSASFFNSRAVIDEEKTVGDLTELALVTAYKKYGLEETFEKISENPFSSDRKMMSTFGKTEGKEVLYLKGAPEVILEKTSHYQSAEGIKAFDEEAKAYFKKELLALENQAYRVLAIAKNDTNSEEGVTFLGFTAILDIARPEVKGALEKCYAAGICTVIITGDNENTAAAIAREIGLKFDGVLTGDEVNDAPALKKADIGISMGSGSEVAKEAGDMVLLDDNFHSIVQAIEEGRTVYFNIKKFVTYILSSNVSEIVPYILSFFLKIPTPLSVIQILSIDLGSDMLPGLALGSEKPEKNIMKRPPVDKKEKILDWEVFKRGYFFIGIIEASAAMFAFITFLLSHGWQYGTVEPNDPHFQAQAMTMTLLGAVTSQMVNMWMMRSWEFNIWTMGWSSNKGILIAFGLVSVWIWALLNVPAIQTVFNTAHVPLEDLWVLLPFPFLILISHESYKYFKYAKKMEH